MAAVPEQEYSFGTLLRLLRNRPLDDRRRRELSEMFGLDPKEISARTPVTQHQLHQLSGLSVRAIQDLEAGVNAAPHPANLKSLAKALSLEGHTLAVFNSFSLRREVNKTTASNSPAHTTAPQTASNRQTIACDSEAKVSTSPESPPNPLSDLGNDAASSIGTGVSDNEPAVNFDPGDTNGLGIFPESPPSRPLGNDAASFTIASLNDNEPPSSAGMLKSNSRKKAERPASRRTPLVRSLGSLFGKYRVAVVVVVVSILAAGSGLWFANQQPQNRSPVEAQDLPQGDALLSAASMWPEVPPNSPDAGRAPTDINDAGGPVILPQTQAGRCVAIVDGAVKVGEVAILAGNEQVARLDAYYSVTKRQACAKLIKPDGSIYSGSRTHMALTLCGDDNSCDFDWNAYPSDAGPVAVPSRDGCMSVRVSMLDKAGKEWIVRDLVQVVNCS